MESTPLLAGLLVAASVVAFALGVAWFLGERNRSRIRERLADPEPGDGTSPDIELVMDPKLSSLPLLDAILDRLRFARRLQDLVLQADVGLRPGAVVLMMLVLAGAGGMLTLAAAKSLVFAIPVGFLLGILPLLVLHRKRIGRVHRFERQFPDALDLMTGALRSGMAFTGALQLVAEESPDPVSKEFLIVFEEHRLGLELRETFTNLLRRMNSEELRLFTTAVLLQRDTGGNLAEVLENAASVIRDRFRILGDVRTITAQARLSGMVLTVLPLVMAVFIGVTAPDYLRTLITDPIGPYLVGVAVGLQLVGFLAIRHIVNIRV